MPDSPQVDFYKLLQQARCPL